jgi:hypothetical protein
VTAVRLRTTRSLHPFGGGPARRVKRHAEKAQSLLTLQLQHNIFKVFKFYQAIGERARSCSTI